ncbi:MAG: AAA family ATPase [Candidatus Izemoplasmatales bacterium]|jgi:adenylate kinase family enzyme
MVTIKTIHVFGASGSGTTTFARAISEKFGYHHIDTDDALWIKTDPPFTHKRTVKESKEIINRQLSEHEFNVISGQFYRWGNFLRGRIDLYVYMHLPVATRLERIRNREIRRFGDRVAPNGDMYKMHLDFLDWAAKYDIGDSTRRSKKQHLEWINKVDKPVLIIEDAFSIEELLSKIEPYLQ